MSKCCVQIIECAFGVEGYGGYYNGVKRPPIHYCLAHKQKVGKCRLDPSTSSFRAEAKRVQELAALRRRLGFSDE